MAWAYTGRFRALAAVRTGASKRSPICTESGNATASAGQPVMQTLRRSAPASRSAQARRPASSGVATVAPPNSQTPPFAPIHEPAATTRSGNASGGDVIAEPDPRTTRGAEIGDGGEPGTEGGEGIGRGIA